MIFAASAKENVMFIFLVQTDLVDLKKGLTKFVDGRMTGNKLFDQVVISLHKDHKEVQDILNKIPGGEQIQVGRLPLPTPKATEEICIGCGGLMGPEQLFKFKCICCWADEAIKLRTQSN